MSFNAVIIIIDTTAHYLSMYLSVCLFHHLIPHCVLSEVFLFFHLIVFRHKQTMFWKGIYFHPDEIYCYLHVEEKGVTYGNTVPVGPWIKYS